MKNIQLTDPQVYQAIMSELDRQQNNLELIASENIVSPAVLEATGSIMTNKYAEGYPNARYYGGCRHIDTVEQLAIDRVKKLFGAEHANVQPHSGTSANTAVYFSMLKPGDTILGMNLSHGGHLTHGCKANISGKFFHAVSYGLDENGFIDYDNVAKLAEEHRPKMIVAGASAYSRIIDWKRFRDIADSIGAYLLVDMAHIAGLVACGCHPSPVPFADFVTSTTHKTLRGPRGGLILCKQQYAAKIDKAIFPGTQGGPLEQIIAAKAVAFNEALQPAYHDYIKAVVANCKTMENVFHKHNIKMVSGGTDNHLLLLDLTGTGMTGAELNDLLEEANITVNKNSIPSDPLPPTVTSGIRVGSAVLTTRGMGEEQFTTVAELIVDIIRNGNEAVERVRTEVLKLTTAFPIYPELV